MIRLLRPGSAFKPACGLQCHDAVGDAAAKIPDCRIRDSALRHDAACGASKSLPSRSPMC